MTTITKNTVTTISLTTADLPFAVDLDHEPVSWIDPVVTKRVDGTYTVTYAVHDLYADSTSPLEDSGVEFEEFRTEWDRDEYFNDTDLTTHVPFIVDHFEHSGHAYSLTNTVGYPYGGWDTRPSCVLRVPVDFTDPREAATALLSEYTAWTNGDVYGIVREDFDADGSRLGYAESVWGFIGTEYAESVVADVDSHL